MNLFLITILYLIIVNNGQILNPDLKDDIQFFCTNTFHREFIQTVVQDSQLNTKLNMSLPLTIVIHGWGDSTNSLLLQIDHMEWVNFVDTNCCAVNWHRLALMEYVIASQINTRITGKYTADFIRPIIELGISPNDISIAGHSLGAHVAGFTGRNLQTYGYTMRYIFGIDPAGPGFTRPINIPYEAKLNRNDAKFVQVVHTSGLTYGTLDSLGDADYYANNARFQPGCLSNLIDSPEQEQLGTIFACSHYRAVQIFYYSLNPDYPFIGTYCEYGGFAGLINNLTNACNNLINDKFGIYTANITGDFQLTTTGKAPFCEGCMTID